MNRIKGLKLAAGLGLGTIASLAIIAPVATSLTQKTNTKAFTSNLTTQNLGDKNDYNPINRVTLNGQFYLDGNLEGITEVSSLDVIFANAVKTEDLVQFHCILTDTNLPELGSYNVYTTTSGNGYLHIRFKNNAVPRYDSGYCGTHMPKFTGTTTFYSSYKEYPRQENGVTVYSNTYASTSEMIAKIRQAPLK